MSFFDWLRIHEKAFLDEYYKMLENYYKETGKEVCRVCGKELSFPVFHDGKAIYVCECGHSFEKGVRNMLYKGKKVVIR